MHWNGFTRGEGVIRRQEMTWKIRGKSNPNVLGCSTQHSRKTGFRWKLQRNGSFLLKFFFFQCRNCRLKEWLLLLDYKRREFNLIIGTQKTSTANWVPAVLHFFPVSHDICLPKARWEKSHLSTQSYSDCRKRKRSGGRMASPTTSASFPAGRIPQGRTKAAPPRTKLARPSGPGDNRPRTAKRARSQGGARSNP